MQVAYQYFVLHNVLNVNCAIFEFLFFRSEGVVCVITIQINGHIFL